MRSVRVHGRAHFSAGRKIHEDARLSSLKFFFLKQWKDFLFGAGAVSTVAKNSREMNYHVYSVRSYKLLNIYVGPSKSYYGVKFQVSRAFHVSPSTRNIVVVVVVVVVTKSNISSTACNNIYIFPRSNYPVQRCCKFVRGVP